MKCFFGTTIQSALVAFWYWKVYARQNLKKIWCHEEIAQVNASIRSHFKKDPLKIGDSAQLLSPPDFARFFKQLTDPNESIRVLSLELIVYLMLAKYQGKKYLLEGVHLDDGLTVFNPINSKQTQNMDVNQILE